MLPGPAHIRTWALRQEGNEWVLSRCGQYDGSEREVGPSLLAIIACLFPCNWSKQAAYFDTCRVKRNTVEYDLAEIASEHETGEIIEQAFAFKDVVNSWIATNHPKLLPKQRSTFESRKPSSTM